jgi:very-short-patch-repair endonuclease
MTETMTAAEYQALAGKGRNASRSQQVRRVFLFQISARKLPTPRSKEHADGEVVFMDGEVVHRHTRRMKHRKRSPGWSFDFAWPEQRIAVEVEGVSVHKADGMFVIGGRHGSIAGFKEDCEKYAWAAVMGWRVMRFEQGQVKAGLAIDMLVRLFAAVNGSPVLEVLTPSGWKASTPEATLGMHLPNSPRITDELQFGHAHEPDPF